MTTPEVTEQAAHVAGLAVTAEHGDNDKPATDALLTDKAIRDRWVPPLAPPAPGRPMFEAWGDHERSEGA